MAPSTLSREQRLRKQAELRSLNINLNNLREREATYIRASAVVPDVLIHQINDIRRQITLIEDELQAAAEPDPAGRQYYRQALEAEEAENQTEALKLYRRAMRQGHPDAAAAIRSVNHSLKMARIRAETAQMRLLTPGRYPRRSLFIALVLFMTLGLLLALAFIRLSQPAQSSQESVVANVPTLTATPTSPAVRLIIPPTPTSLPTSTPTSTGTPAPTDTPEPEPIRVTFPTATWTPTPTPASTLRPAPQIIGPRDDLVWNDGAIVFEFVPLDLEEDELYCLDTLRGFDNTNTENWSYVPTGSERPSIAIEANVFRVARDQGMRCVVWTAGIGKGTCERIISELTPKRVIGLPRPCNFAP
jgi:hypothetical protein